jgi:transcriptional regulator with XRE-family HTH domain
MNIGKSINIALAKREMKRKDLSVAAKVTRPYLSLVISGKMEPKITTVERLAKATGFTVSEFISLGE